MEIVKNYSKHVSQIEFEPPSCGLVTQRGKHCNQYFTQYKWAFRGVHYSEFLYWNMFTKKAIEEYGFSNALWSCKRAGKI